MTKVQQRTEMLYQASLAPFKKMLRNGTISVEDYRIIDTILREKYHPIFVEYIIEKTLDISAKQS